MLSDPIEFELFKNSLFSVADEMALTIFRTTYSGVLKDIWTIRPRCSTARGSWRRRG